MKKRILMFLAILVTTAQVWGATPQTVNDAKQQYIQKFPWIMLLALDPSDPTKVIPVAIDGDGNFTVVFPSGGAGAVDQGDQAATSGFPWFFTMTRRSDGAEFGLAASPFGVQLFNAVGAALGETANPLIIQNLATAPASFRLSTGTVFYDAMDQATGEEIELNTDSPTTPGEGTVSVTATAVEILAPDPNRRSALIRNADSNTVLFLGFTSGVTTANGLPVGTAGATGANGNGGTVIYTHTGAIWGIVDSGSADVRWQTEAD